MWYEIYPIKNFFLKVSLLMAEQGVHTIAYAFPKVNIVTTAVDPEINDKWDHLRDSIRLPLT